MQVIYEDNHIIVVIKPCNVPMMQDSSNDLDMLTMVKQYLKDKYQKPGNVYCGLVHRLDRPVGGICVFAKTSKAASRLSDQIRQNKLHKVYTAVVIDNNLKQSDTFIDNLLKDEKTNMVKVDPKGKKSSLDYVILSKNNNLAKVKINLHTGRSHQIRVQFSSRNHALWGDQRYNSKAIKGQQIALWATELSFIHPTLKEPMTFKCDTPNTYPWNI